MVLITNLEQTRKKALEFADVIITSPGVPPKAFIIQEAEKEILK
jgi:UDP-N-acetylmuramoylalanine-D-glutamate ligase